MLVSKYSRFVSLSEENGIRRLSLSNSVNNIDINLGVEVGTIDSFYSFENRCLGSSIVIEENSDVFSSGEWSLGAKVKFSRAALRLNEDGMALADVGWRTIHLTAIEDSVVMDCVLRFVVDKKLVARARIGNNFLEHRRSNKYHQYPFSGAEIYFYDGRSIVFSPRINTIPTGMSPVVYLRDEPNHWVLHFRALATTPAHFEFKGCHRLFNKPFPRFIQQIVCRQEWLRDRLLYVRERVSQRIPVQVNGAITLKKNEEISFGVDWRWSD